MKKSTQRGLRIMLVEDDPWNQFPMQRLLEKAGHEVVLAENGQQAVDLYNEQSFDCILMDVKMPVMNGVEATKRIRRQESEARSQNPEFRSQESKNSIEKPKSTTEASKPLTSYPEPRTFQRIPIIALTAYAMAGDREIFLEAGMDDYLAKPVRMQDLYRLLERVAQSRLAHRGCPEDEASCSTGARFQHAIRPRNAQPHAENRRS